MPLSTTAQRETAAITGRLSLRAPQREALELLAELAELIPLRKDADLAASLAAVQTTWARVESFEQRDFVSLCFSLATGVGKTRLMGAFAAYLHRVHGVRHFFVLAPNLTIYNKLIQDFTPGTPKYVFQGISEFATEAPLLITGENYQSSLAVRQQDLFGRDERVHINVFNIAKLAKDAKAPKGSDGAPRIKRLSEYIGQSYFDYLASLDDLVLLMDESHRYRADAGVAVLNELRPVLGLELTATPQVETTRGPQRFRNIVYEYPLAAAIRDGYVKEPAVATRENFDSTAYSEPQLERLKLEDGIRLHEATKVELQTYARQRTQPEQRAVPVKPFMLVVAQSTEHAEALVQLMQQPDFFEGRYKGRVITVHSNQRGQEADEVVQSLLRVESPDEPTEVVVHVDKLKEGWDVTNLYTIVPLRAANARNLVEQTIGRGLRLPYGRRTGVPTVDRLTIVSHDRFQEIVDAANDPNWIIRQTIVLGRDVPLTPKTAVTVQPIALAALLTPAVLSGSGGGTEAATDEAPAVVTSPHTHDVAQVTLAGIEQVKRQLGVAQVPNVEALQRPEVRAAVVSYVAENLPAYQLSTQARQAMLDFAPPTASDIVAFTNRVIDAVAQSTISLPRIIVVPTGEVTSGFRDFDLDATGIAYQPVQESILVEHLQSGQRHRMTAGGTGARETRPADYVVRELLDYHDISYDDHADLLYKLAEQLVEHLHSYLLDEAAVENVLQYYGRPLGQFVHAQMNRHFQSRATGYTAQVTQGFETPRSLNYTEATGQTAQHFRAPVDQPARIRELSFTGFGKCLYPVQKFDSDTERQFASLLEQDSEVLRWFRPVPDQIQIFLEGGGRYQPDFIVETTIGKVLCETKRRDVLDTPEVQAKKQAAQTWCQHATAHEQQHGGKAWQYLLVPHDDVRANYTLAGLLARYNSQY